MNKILIGVTGSIAAYKIAELTRLLKKANFEVRIAMTESATKIITPMTLQVLSQNDVRVDLFNHEDESKIDHIALARWADTIVITPATANFMAKMAVGIADDLLSTICLATDVPIVIAPAMNHLMWSHVATQENTRTLQQRGVEVILPDDGEQACGEIGAGRMAEPDAIVAYLQQRVNAEKSQPLAGKKILITAGPTIERIDPVRYITNDSSGKMGYALAENARNLGAEVILISGKTTLAQPSGIKVVDVLSAQNMYDAVMDHVDACNWFIASAAVSDYAVEKPAVQKMKKQGDDNLSLNLIQNPDILKSVCQRDNNLFCVGFAAETENVIEYAQQKRLRKGADVIIANDVSRTDSGFNADTNTVTVISDNEERHFPSMTKQALAKELLLTLLEYNS